MRFASCCERAYASALQLAAWAGNVTVESLKAYYIESCEADWFEKSHNFAPEFGNGEESDDEREAAQDVSLAGVTKRLDYFLKYSILPTVFIQYLMYLDVLIYFDAF